MRKRRLQVAALFDPYLPQLRDVVRGMIDFVSERQPEWEIVMAHLAVKDTPSKEPIALSRFDGFIDSNPLPRTTRFLHGRPTVLLEETRIDRGIPIVCTDMAGVGRACAEHLAESGLRQFAVVTSPGSERGPDRLRRDGFRDWLRGHGFDEPTVFQSGVRMDASAEWSWEDQVDDLADWLATQPRPIGVMAVDIAYGWRTLTATQHTGLRVPEDVCLVVGGDDELILGGLRPSLSGVAYHQKRVGFQAAEVLHRILSGEQVPSLQRVRPLGVIERQSSLFTASEDPLVEKMMQYIWRHVEKGVTVQQITALVPVSQRTLVRRFEKAIGRTPHEEIRRSQLQTARRLLTTTDFSLREVAARSGLGTPTNLSQAVRRVSGVSPSELRRQHR
ncbi:MAG: substrate-binding domain-containing protein [Planctomycetota bacterium]